MKLNILNNEFRFWRGLINIWSILFFTLIISDFLYANAYAAALNAIATIYVSILAIYVSNKEFERWYDRHQESHPGEVFVIMWTGIVISLLALDFIYGAAYELPSAVISAYIAVLTILVITRKSKELYGLQKKKQRKRVITKAK
ncbi:MAG: hypothetical protein PHE20_03090 [Patescibacteria group bacterium]|nr:hypothetical protein [Patescibacteria group bacterium]